MAFSSSVFSKSHSFHNNQSSHPYLIKSTSNSNMQGVSCPSHPNLIINTICTMCIQPLCSECQQTHQTLHLNHSNPSQIENIEMVRLRCETQIQSILKNLDKAKHDIENEAQIFNRLQRTQMHSQLQEAQIKVQKLVESHFETYEREISKINVFGSFLGEDMDQYNDKQLSIQNEVGNIQENINGSLYIQAIIDFLELYPEQFIKQIEQQNLHFLREIQKMNHQSQEIQYFQVNEPILTEIKKNLDRYFFQFNTASNLEQFNRELERTNNFRSQQLEVLQEVQQQHLQFSNNKQQSQSSHNPQAPIPLPHIMQTSVSGKPKNKIFGPSREYQTDHQEIHPELTKTKKLDQSFRKSNNIHNSPYTLPPPPPPQKSNFEEFLKKSPHASSLSPIQQFGNTQSFRDLDISKTYGMGSEQRKNNLPLDPYSQLEAISQKKERQKEKMDSIKNRMDRISKRFQRINNHSEI